MNKTTRKRRNHGGIHVRRLLENDCSSRVAPGYSIPKRTIADACTSHLITACAQSHGCPDYVDQTGGPEVNPGVAQVFVRDYGGGLAGSAQHHAGVALPVPLIRTAGGPPVARRVPA